MLVRDKPIAEYMRTPIYSVTVDDDLSTVERLLSERRVSCVPVVGRDGRAVGVASRTDLLSLGRVVARSRGVPAALHLPAMCIGDAVKSGVIAAAGDTTVAQAARTMVDRHIHRLFVLDDGRPIGVFSTKEVMRAVIDAELTAELSVYMSKPVISVDVADPVSKAIDELAGSRVSGIVVFESGSPVGLFTQVEALEARDVPPTTPVSDLMGYSMLCLPVNMALHRAAGFAITTRVRRILAVEHRDVWGILTGLDFARAISK